MHTHTHITYIDVRGK